MIFRATQKVSSKLRIACTAIVDSHPLMVEWYCNLITVRRRQFFLFTHASSLFSFWAPAAGSTLDDFGQVFRQHATDTLRGYGFTSADTAKVIDDGPDAFAKATDRGVIGSMVDYTKMLRHAVEEGSAWRARRSISGKFSAPKDRITSQCTGPGLALLAPAGDRERSAKSRGGVVLVLARLPGQ